MEPTSTKMPLGHANLQLKGQLFVVKIGGEVAADRGALQRLLTDLKTLKDAGAHLLLLHGGGPQATALSKRLGLEPKLVGGRRITDTDTLEVMKMAVAGQINIDLVAASEARGIPALGLSGPSGGIMRARKRPPRVVSGSGGEVVDFGWVGDITAVGTHTIQALLELGYMPVLNSLAADDMGQVYNINADTAANAVAAALGAHRLLMLTSAPGVLADKDDPNTRFAILTEATARQAIESGAIQGGMIPKVEESLEALHNGVQALHILQANEPGALVKEVCEPGSVGTVLKLH